MTTRKMQWDTLDYPLEERQRIERFLVAHPMIARGPGEWECVIPEGIYVVADRRGRYVATFIPAFGLRVTVSTTCWRGHVDDAWARTVLAVMRDADGRTAWPQRDAGHAEMLPQRTGRRVA